MNAMQQENRASAQIFLEILLKQEITTHFQAIVSLEEGTVLGYEALSRGPAGTWFYRPDRLFEYARKIERVWELDLLCRTMAIRRARDVIGSQKLFINVDPHSIHDPKFQRGFTREYLKHFELDPGNVVMELTEKTAVQDYRHFNQLLRNYREQGYGIAVDDAGSGYSGLRLIAETRPDYIKIDMELVRNLDKDMMKRELLKSIQNFSRMTGIQTIAEGIETWEEAKTLMELGVDYGQGYWLQRPAAEMKEPESDCLDTIRHYARLLKKSKDCRSMLTAQDVLRKDEGIQMDERCHTVNDRFAENEHLQGIVILDGAKPVGLVMRSKFYYMLEKFGHAHHDEPFLDSSVMMVADKKLMAAACDTPLKDVCRMAMARSEYQLYDYMVIQEQHCYQGVIPVALLLDALTRSLD